jgi:crotonobetainyl-CoA:carnitine CoA-transferase CaiB-like acyl-CoA transferase
MTDHASDRPLPLEGLKVLDFTQNLPGPYATFLLASWGADVVKVEPPKGDPGRFMQPFFAMVNRGKRSVVLDLRDESSRPALEALVKWADVLVEGFRPGVMARLGCDWETAAALNPKLLYCSISAFGQEGPLRDHPGHDLNLQALSGVCHMERDAKGAPRYSMLPIADLSSSLLAVSGICAALAARRERGEGAYLDVAMADGVLSWANLWGRGVDLAGNAEKQLAGGPAVEALTRPLIEFLDRVKLYAMPHYGVFRCADGAYLSVGIVDEAHFWKALCAELDLAPLAGLPLPARIAAGPALRPLVARRLRKRPRDEWLARFERAGIPASAVLRPDEVPDQPQVRARGLVDERGWTRAPLPGAVFPSRGAPKRGEHTDEVLAMLGLESATAAADTA